MTVVNGVPVPTCAELAEVLKAYGDRPLYSGRGWYATYGFRVVDGGVQISALMCPPEGGDVSRRDAR